MNNDIKKTLNLTDRQAKAVEMMRTGYFGEDQARDMFGPRFRLTLHPLIERGLVLSSPYNTKEASYSLSLEAQRLLQEQEET